jgi:hypothetical protein
VKSAARLIVLGLAGLCCEALFSGEKPAPPAAGARLLDTDSQWRMHVTWLPAAIRKESGDLEILRTMPVRLGKEVQQVETLASTPPPTEWTSPDFDDSDWPRMPGPFAFTKGYPFGEPRHWHEYGLLCLRGRFLVADPAKTGDLTLSVSYWGGVVVHLNGKEIARSDMPDGKLSADTPALDYPQEAYKDSTGAFFKNLSTTNDVDKKRMALRTRSTDNVKIPAAALRAGINTLCVEIHRAPMAEGYAKGPSIIGNHQGNWLMLGFLGMKLAAQSSAIVDADSKPGMKILCLNHLVDLYDMAGDIPNESQHPVSLVSPRNGFASGRAAVISSRDINGLSVVTDDLKHAGPGKPMPASAVQVRYENPDGYEEPSKGHYRNGKARRFDGLEESAPAAVIARKGTPGAIQPLWITVHVPANAAPGDYKGIIRVIAGAESAELPLRLSVADFPVPDPNEYASFIGLVQSPDSLALRYNVTPWSDRHCELVARSFRLLGLVGNDFLVIPLVINTTYGNRESMVRLLRQTDGSFKHDLGAAEKYVDLAIKNMGKPKLVCLCVWEPIDAYGNAGKDGKGCPMQVTVIEPDGKVGSMPVPEWGTPESPKFWKPVFDETIKMLAARGLDKTACLGTATQAPPGKPVTDDLDSVVPELLWYSVSHNYESKFRGKPTAAGVHVYALGATSDQVPARRYYGWNHQHLNPHYPRGRDMPVLGEGSPSGFFNLLLEAELVRDARGMGNLGADFWFVGNGGRSRIIRGNWCQLEIGGWTAGCILAAGTNGPVSSVRFEALREGVQEAETRIFMEKLLCDPPEKTGVAAELAERARKILDERARAVAYASASSGPEEGFFWWAQSSGDYRRRLYSVAAEMAKTAKSRTF